MGALLLDRYDFDFLMILKETLTFLSLSNPVLQRRRFPPSYLMEYSLAEFIGAVDVSTLFEQAFHKLEVQFLVRLRRLAELSEILNQCAITRRRILPAAAFL